MACAFGLLQMHLSMLSPQVGKRRLASSADWLIRCLCALMNGGWVFSGWGEASHEEVVRVQRMGLASWPLAATRESPVSDEHVHV